MKPVTNVVNTESRWQGLYKTGGMAALAMFVIMLVQVIVFMIWPPPATVEGFFALFQQNGLLGLLSLDLLYIINNTLLILVYLALYFSLRRSAESASLIALVLSVVGVAVYYSSNTAFEMLSLSGQYAAAATELQRTITLSAGQVMLETYKGTSFDIYYVLNAIALLIFAVVMLRSKFYSRATAVWGLVAGVLMSIPSTAGTVGLIFSLASLIPWAVFSLLVAKKLLQTGPLPQ